jgi:uncharacterized protein
VWGGDADPDSDAPFASGKQKKRHRAGAAPPACHRPGAAHHPDRWEPVFSVAEDGDREYADAEDWCIGFLQATAMDTRRLGPAVRRPRAGPALLPIALLGGDDSQLAPADAERLADPGHRDELSRSLPDGGAGAGPAPALSR